MVQKKHDVGCRVQFCAKEFITKKDHIAKCIENELIFTLFSRYLRASSVCTKVTNNISLCNVIVEPLSGSQEHFNVR